MANRASTTEFWASLDAEARVGLGWTRRSLAGGEWLWESGDSGDSVAWVEGGRLRVLVEGRERGMIAAGELIGEASAFTPGARRTAAVQAIEPAQVWVLDGPGLSLLRARAPELYEALLVHALATLVQRVADNEAELAQRRRGEPELTTASEVGEPGPTIDLEPALRRLPRLADAEPPLVVELAGLCELRELAAGELLCRAGDAAEGLYLLGAGLLAVEIASQRGGTLEVARAQPGDLLGTTAVLDGVVRTASLRALRASQVYVLARERLPELRPAARWALYECLARILRSQLTQAHAASLRSRGARGTINLEDAMPALGWLHRWQRPEPSDLTLTELPTIAGASPREPGLEARLRTIREAVIGADVALDGPFGRKRVVYADYTASGRSLSFIEDYLRDQVMPLYANTHSEASESGRQTTHFREQARALIKRCVGANEHDALVFVGSGATGAVLKLLGMLNLRLPPELDRRYRLGEQIPAHERPVVFVGPYEHHSNILPWRHSIAEVRVVPLAADGGVDLAALERLLIDYADRPVKIGSFTAASNVTGALTDTVAVATLLHRHGALSCWDYAAAGPYVEIAMNPRGEGIDEGLAYKDAVFLSPHKFIGGPGTPGLLVVKRALASNAIPSDPGGGTVDFVTFDEALYTEDVEAREEGGTPAILGSIRCGLVFQLKDQVGVANIAALERDFVGRAIASWRANPAIHIVGNPDIDRLSITSLMISHGSRYLHYGLVTALLNDLFGIQARGGCSCAGPYGALLLGVGEDTGEMFLNLAEHGWKSLKPGWVRVNFNYFISEDEFRYIVDAVHLIALHGWALAPRYRFDPRSGHWQHREAERGRPRSLTELQLVDGEPRWGPGYPRVGQDQLATQLEHGRAVLEDARRSLPPSVEPLGLPEAFEAARWFPLAHEIAAELGAANAPADPG